MKSGVPSVVPEEAQRLLRLVDSGEVLGATRQLVLLGQYLVVLAQSDSNEPDLRAATMSLLHHIERTRGESSQAVTNGVRIMAAPAFHIADGNLATSIESAVQCFQDSIHAWVSSVRTHATELLKPCTTFLAYDYSSTVSSVLADLSRTGSDITVFIPEARSLGGGKKYLTDWQDLGITAHLIPDAALGWALGLCDAALAGAETLSAEGGCYNTIGTAIAAHEAKRSHVPFYVLSILLKTDPRTLGAERPIPLLDFTSTRFFADQPLAQGIHIKGTFPDLDYTPPAAITAAITEQGSLRPSDIAEAARLLFIDAAASRG